LLRRKKKEKEKLSACRGEGSAAGPLLVVLAVAGCAAIYRLDWYAVFPLC
jgi:hypothetical protein